MSKGMELLMSKVGQALSSKSGDCNQREGRDGQYPITDLYSRVCYRNKHGTIINLQINMEINNTNIFIYIRSLCAQFVLTFNFRFFISPYLMALFLTPIHLHCGCHNKSSIGSAVLATESFFWIQTDRKYICRYKK